MIDGIATGTTVEVISEEQPARRFHAKVTSSGTRTRIGEPPVPWVHLGAGNGQWGLTVKLSDIDQLAPIIRDMPGKLYIVLSEDVIDSARVERSRHRSLKLGRINAFDQFEIGEPIRVYAKMPLRNNIRVTRRVHPDWIIDSVSPMLGKVYLRQGGYVRYDPIAVDLHQMLRDVNSNLRAYIDGKFLTPAGLHRVYNEITAEGDAEMAMSKDRVEFVLGPFNANYQDTHTADHASVKAAKEAFGLTDEEEKRMWGGPVTSQIIFIVRPSQFARFLILRNEYGVTNDFKGLKAKLIEAPPPPPTKIDASGRHNEVTF